jgi:putative nucleotidyltransferase with HDIG domain
LLGSAWELDRSGRRADAAVQYTAAVATAAEEGEVRVLATALRRFALLKHRQRDSDAARELCRRSHATAMGIPDAVLAAEAINLLAGIAIEQGDLDEARDRLEEALRVGAESSELRGRVEQNLGVIANIRGDLTAALGHYERSLDAFLAGGDTRSCAIAYNNLGMVSADRHRYEDADRYFRRCVAHADEAGDVHLRGLGLLNHTEVFLARRAFDEARASAEAALLIFDGLGAVRNKSDAYKFLGVVYRETGRTALAEARLRAALEFAVEAGAVLEEAEASRELARLYRDLGRNQDALQLLNASYRLFRRLDAHRDLIDVGGKVADLENTYLAVVRGWGESIESSDSYTHGHCERVATYAARVALALGLTDDEVTTVRLGAYLHDVGKVRVPHEILNKPGRLTDAEFQVMQQHPVYGVELLADVDFPWDIKPIIRWHHEKYDGTGYPDGLRGDEIPLHAQIVCVADVYDALTTSRSYRSAMSQERALSILEQSRHHWRPDVFGAFMTSVPAWPIPVADDLPAPGDAELRASGRAA